MVFTSTVYWVNSVGNVAVVIHSPPNFTGPKLIGHLVAEMFLGQVFHHQFIH